jgi:hypothetical protein
MPPDVNAALTNPDATDDQWTAALAWFQSNATPNQVGKPVTVNSIWQEHQTAFYVLGGAVAFLAVIKVLQR